MNELAVEKFEVKYMPETEFPEGTLLEEYKVRFWIDGQKHVLRLSPEDFEAIKVAPGAITPVFTQKEDIR